MSRETIHPPLLRATHWLNAVAVIIMIGSGLQIHNAYPILPWAVPSALTIGGWLGGATRWHFAAMWLLVGNGLVYLGHGIVTGRLRRRMWPLRLRDLAGDLAAALRGRIRHDAPGTYNAVQRACYLGVIGALVLALLSGLALWKPVQFGGLSALLGDFDTTRLVHFGAMVAIVLFLLLHVTMAMLVPRTLRAMLVGR